MNVGSSRRPSTYPKVSVTLFYGQIRLGVGAASWGSNQTVALVNVTWRQVAMRRTRQKMHDLHQGLAHGERPHGTHRHPVDGSL